MPSGLSPDRHHSTLPACLREQILDELGEGQTEEQIRAVLADSSVANGLLWITPDVADSDVIRYVEAPGLIARARVDDSFFVLPVAAGGLDYYAAAATLDGGIGLDDLS